MQRSDSAGEFLMTTGLFHSFYLKALQGMQRNITLQTFDSFDELPLLKIVLKTRLQPWCALHLKDKCICGGLSVISTDRKGYKVNSVIVCATTLPTIK